MDSTPPSTTITREQQMSRLRLIHRKRFAKTSRRQPTLSLVSKPVRGGRSSCEWVKRFMNFDKLHVSHVSWLSLPDYPTGSPVVVRLVTDDPKPNEDCTVSLVDIDPTHVTILHQDTCMYMLRMNDINTMTRIR